MGDYVPLSGKRHRTAVFLAAALSGIALMADAPNAAGDVMLAGICMPLTSRFTKCIEGKVSECVRRRTLKCKTKETCTPTQESCDLTLIR
jgi:hypothetical protein